MGDAGAGLGEPADLGGREVDAVRAPDVAVEPAEAVEIFDRRAAVELLAVRLLFHRLREVGVQVQAEPARELGRLLHQPSRDGEGRAGCYGDLDPRPDRSVQLACESLRVGEHRVDVLHQLIGWQAAVRDTEIHGTA